MPLDAHYGGHGREVMAKMKRRYGKRGERVFYATANRHKKKVKRLVHRRKMKGTDARAHQDKA